MAATLKASKTALDRIKQVRNSIGWTIEDERWLLAASQILEPERDWQPGSAYYAHGCSEMTWKRFLLGKAIGSAAFKAFCQVLGMDWEEVVDRTIPEEVKLDFVEPKQPISDRRFDWNKAPEPMTFYGRQKELATLEQWIVNDRCRSIALWGMAGIGKTALAVKLAKQIAPQFEYVIWRSLSLSPTIEQTVSNLLECLSAQQQSQADLDRLLDYLRSHRCLVVLDGVEAILSNGELAGKYRDGYQEYGRLFRQVGELPHQSCLLLTSSEKIRDITLWEGDASPIRSLKLTGLSKEAARELLRAKGLPEESKWGFLIDRYIGHPLALKIVAGTILELFNGNVSQFIKQKTTFLGQFNEVLAPQFDRLSDLEITVMCQMAATDRPISIQELKAAIPLNVSTSKLMESLESLWWRSLIEKISDTEEVSFTLQSIVRKYVFNHYSEYIF